MKRTYVAAVAALGLGGALAGGIAMADPNPDKDAAKEACKNGGWQALEFKNQGQCIKGFVAPAPTSPTAVPTETSGSS
jgi:hypothetical protein